MQLLPKVDLGSIARIGRVKVLMTRSLTAGEGVEVDAGAKGLDARTISATGDHLGGTSRSGSLELIR
jgi:hypothetical protein